MFEAVTDGIIVRARPRFLPEQSNPERSRYVWAYEIEIVNATPNSVQLISRFWSITDEAGAHQEVRGPGVVGETPVIEPGDSFTYTSACPLAAPSGVMVGAYQMRRVRDDFRFEVAIPAFALDSPFVTRLAN